MSELPVARIADRNQNKVALTFDDGPNPYFTLRILDLLDAHNVKGNFFVIGQRCLEHPEILKEIHKRGHLIGNHTFSHTIGDFKKCDEIINDILGITFNFVRPPSYDISFCKKECDYLQGKQIITGDVNSKDYLDITSEEVIENVINDVQNGSIIDFHDGSETDEDLKVRAQKTLDALSSIIDKLKSKNCILARLDDMNLSFTLEIL